MSVLISSELRSEINDIFMRPGPAERLYVFDNIPPKLLKNATESFAPKIGTDEAIILLYDDTLFSSGKDGFILTTKVLYYKNFTESSSAVKIENIIDMTIERAGLQKNIIVNTSFSKLKINLTSTQNKDAVFNVLNGVVGLFQSKTSSSSSNADQADNNEPLICRGCGAREFNLANICEYCGTAV